MARYKDYNYDQMKMLPVSYEKQILPGSFEYSLSYLIDNELDLSAFDQQYQNDSTGRPAYDPQTAVKDRHSRLFQRHYQQSPDRTPVP